MREQCCVAVAEPQGRGRERERACTRARVQREEGAKPRTRVHACGFQGGHIRLATKQLVFVWASLRAKRIKPFDVRVWLASVELVKQRTFAGKGVKPVYELKELVDLVGGGGERSLREGLSRLRRAGVMSWEGESGPRFAESTDSLAVEALPFVQKMEALMPDRRAFFPMPRPMLRLLAGGVKRATLATVFAHLLRCPHRKHGSWDPVGTVKANWVKEAFGISERSAVYARTHLINVLGWLAPVPSPVWHQKKYGGSFAVRLGWTKETPAELTKAQETVDNSRAASVESADQNRPIAAQFADLESKQTSPSEIQESDLVASPPDPRVDSWKKLGRKPEANLPAPRLAKLIPEDLPSVARVMELFDQALDSPAWRRRGWTPTDSYLERLNWAAAARRAHVRGSTNPCGVFVHLVSQRKWGHVSNDDEEAVRRDVARWMNPEPEAPSYDGGGARRTVPKLSQDAKVLRVVEAALRRHGVDTSAQRVNRELAQRGGWSTERIAEARRAFEAWKNGGSTHVQPLECA